MIHYSTAFEDITPIKLRIRSKQNNYINILMSFKIIKSSQEREDTASFNFPGKN